MTDVQSLITIDPTIRFDFEDYVSKELEIALVKPPSVPVCKYFLKNMCRVQNCPYKHPPKGKTVVCKHWLRGLCKKGELCEFLHQYNMKKMPECWFYTKLGECTNPECQYLHIDPDSKLKECAWYARGFCKHGADCRHKHTRGAVCQMYLTGFCPEGENCEFGHVNHLISPNTNYPYLSTLMTDYRNLKQRTSEGKARGTWSRLHVSSAEKQGTMPITVRNEGEQMNNCCILEM